MIEDVLKLCRYFGSCLLPLRDGDKMPRLARWQDLKLTEEQIVSAWESWPRANVGLRTGATGWVAIDCDGEQWLQWAKDTLPPTPLETISGSGKGGHLIYRWPRGLAVPKQRIARGEGKHEGVDFYGDGGQIVLPPSIHPSGGVYRWRNGGDLPDHALVPVFDLAWLPEEQKPQQQTVRNDGPPAPTTRGGMSLIDRARRWMAKRDPAIEGNQGDLHTFTTAATLVRDFGLDMSEAWPLLVEWNDTCQPPWRHGDLRAKLQSAARNGSHAIGNKATTNAPPPGGYAAALAADVAAWNTPTAPTPPVELQLPDVTTRGAPRKDSTANTVALLQHYGVRVRYNLMTHGHEIVIPDFIVAEERARNAGLSWVCNRAADHGLSRAAIPFHLEELAREYHPVFDWATSQDWDGVNRLDDLLNSIELQPQADGDFCGLLIHRWLISAAAAILPDHRGQFAAQGVLVIQGEQGAGKTRWVRSLAPPTGNDWVLTGRMLDPRDRDSVQQATSAWIAELGEVDATFRKADIAAIKAFVTQDSDTYRSAFAKREEKVKRRTVFVASVNEAEYLVDTTGNRRWWTVPIKRCHPDHGINLQQFWAQMISEARAGARYWLNDDECARLAEINAHHEPDDALASEVRDTWAPAPFDVSAAKGHSLSEVCRALPSYESGKAPTPREQHRIVSELRRMGVSSKRTRHGRVYFVAHRNPMTSNPIHDWRVA